MQTNKKTPPSQSSLNTYIEGNNCQTRDTSWFSGNRRLSLSPAAYLSACQTYCKQDIMKRTGSALSVLVMVILLATNIRTNAVCSVNTLQQSSTGISMLPYLLIQRQSKVLAKGSKQPKDSQHRLEQLLAFFPPVLLYIVYSGHGLEER